MHDLESTGGEPRIGGESPTAAEVSDAQRVTLSQDLEAAGYGGCAEDLAAADDPDVSQVAYDIADQIITMHGDENTLYLARRLRDWSDRFDDLDPRNAGVTKKPGP